MASTAGCQLVMLESTLHTSNPDITYTYLEGHGCRPITWHERRLQRLHNVARLVCACLCHHGRVHRTITNTAAEPRSLANGMGAQSLQAGIHHTWR
jgi:hypothetical protein